MFTTQQHKKETLLACLEGLRYVTWQKISVRKFALAKKFLAEKFVGCLEGLGPNIKKSKIA